MAPPTTFSWPTYIAKEGGYFDKYDIKANIISTDFVSGIVLLSAGRSDVVLTTLEQALELAATYPDIVIVGSPLRKWLFALITGKNVTRVEDLRGKRIGVTRLGDGAYVYARQLLKLSGLKASDVDWVPVGPTGRAPALTSKRVDATMLSAPAYFVLEKEDFRVLANIINHESIRVTNVFVFRKASLAKDPSLVERFVKAHAEAVKRFYEDKAFTVRALLIYDKQSAAGLDRVYDSYAQSRAMDQVPYITSEDVQYVLNTSENSRLREFDYHGVIDNSALDHAAKEGFFVDLFGQEVGFSQAIQSKAAFR